MYNKIKTLNIKDLKIRNDVNKKSREINNYIQSLEKEKLSVVKNTKDYETIEAQEESSELKLNSNYLHYLAFTLGALAIGGVTIRILSNSD